MNNRGWGMDSMIAIIIAFAVVLIVVAAVVARKKHANCLVLFSLIFFMPW